MKYDVIIIGGGPSGLMAAIAASRGGASTLLIDKGNKLGRKLAISGGGRCNVTNNKDRDELIRNIPGNGRFLFSAMSSYDNRSIIGFFEGLGIQLKEEDNGRMFPVNDKAKTVVDTLIAQIRRQNVEILVQSPVQKVCYRDQDVAGVELKSGEFIESTCVIIATGGKSVPHTGSTGDGYPWAIEAGHTITELFPTEVPITSHDEFIQSRELQGLSLQGVTLTVWNPKNKAIISHNGDMIFTHFGISGPIALRCSQFVLKAMKQFDIRQVRVTLDLFPNKTVEQIYEETLDLAKQSRKAIRNILKSYVPERIVPVLLRKSGLSGDSTSDHIRKQAWQELSRLMKAFPINANGTLSIEEAFVTGGGVHLKEIDPKTMQSKLMPGLFFCGEILDIHGYTGGYNITAAFVTGHTAGSNAADWCRFN